jgi:maltodextrin utilization protein YvdJ
MKKLIEFYKEYKAYIRVDLIMYVVMIVLLLGAVVVISLLKR